MRPWLRHGRCTLKTVLWCIARVPAHMHVRAPKILDDLLTYPDGVVRVLW